jgi:hypothetical protein
MSDLIWLVVYLPIAAGFILNVWAAFTADTDANYND